MVSTHLPTCASTYASGGATAYASTRTSTHGTRGVSARASLRAAVSAHAFLWTTLMACALISLAPAFAPAFGLGSAPAHAGEIADHPDQLTFPELTFTPPEPADYRHELDCGVTAYIAENHTVPTFELTILARTGSMYEPVEKAGLATMTGHLMRNGGAGELTASELDERLAYLAGTIDVRMLDDQARVSLFCLSKDVDEGLDLLRKVLREPLFDQAMLERHRTDMLAELEQGNASTAAIEDREWAFLLYGHHPCTNRYRRTAASLESITREDVKSFHARFFFPANFVVAVSGDFEIRAAIERLENLFADWPSPRIMIPPVTDQVAEPAPGVYMIPKADVNQSRVRIGHLGVTRDIPEQYALMLMNEILGGGGFSSRITRRVRSDEGLAYSTGSRFDRPVDYPGTFRAWLQTKHATAAFGSRLIVDEIERIRDERCSEDALELAKASFIGNLVNPFSSKSSIVETFAQDDFTGRPDDYWQDYQEKIQSVTPEQAQEAARKFLHPDELIFLVVGDPEAVQAGSEKHPDRFSDFGKVTVMPLRNPMTLAFE